MEVGKIPPHDIEAEQAVLGSMLTDKEAVFSALELLKEVNQLKNPDLLYPGQKLLIPR